MDLILSLINSLPRISRVKTISRTWTMAKVYAPGRIHPTAMKQARQFEQPVIDDCAAQPKSICHIILGWIAGHGGDYFVLVSRQRQKDCLIGEIESWSYFLTSMGFLGPCKN